MSINSKAPKTNTPNPNSNYKPPIGNHIPIIEIIYSKDGVYNVLQHLTDYIGTFTLKFKDLTI